MPADPWPHGRSIPGNRSPRSHRRPPPAGFSPGLPGLVDDPGSQIGAPLPEDHRRPVQELGAIAHPAIPPIGKRPLSRRHRLVHVCGRGRGGPPHDFAGPRRVERGKPVGGLDGSPPDDQRVETPELAPDAGERLGEAVALDGQGKVRPGFVREGGQSVPAGTRRRGGGGGLSRRVGLRGREQRVRRFAFRETAAEEGFVGGVFQQPTYRAPDTPCPGSVLRRACRPARAPPARVAPGPGAPPCRREPDTPRSSAGGPSPRGTPRRRRSTGCCGYPGRGPPCSLAPGSSASGARSTHPSGSSPHRRESAIPPTSHARPRNPSTLPLPVER